MKTLQELEKAWNLENERFTKFQRLARRDMQLARAVLSDKQKVDLEILTKIKNRKEVSKSISEHLLLSNEEVNEISSELERLTRKFDELSARQNQLSLGRLDQQENEELESDNDILRSQIEFVKSIMPKIEPEIFKNAKLFSLSEIDKFHHIRTSWQEDELTGVHITLNSLQTKNEESLASIEPVSIELTSQCNSIKRSNHIMRQRKEKTRKSLDSYPEWVERIQQERFNNEVECLELQAEIDAKEKIYKQEFEKNFETGEKLTNKIHDAQSKLYEVEILNSELEKEIAFREKRATELEMLERALQQQDADFDQEILKLKKRKNLTSDT